jgi:peptide deformylase
LINDLGDTLADFQRRTGYGRGIAAPQIAVAKRVVFIRPSGGKRLVLINPEIVWRSPETFVVWDACFSYFTLFFQVERARMVRVRYLDPGGRENTLEAEGELSELLQHEIDHLDGRLAIDLVKDPTSFCTVREYERRYRAAR